MPAGRHTVLGYIDRINRINDDTIEVVDYKTNRMLFTRDEVDASLQLTLYDIAVRRLYPWVKNVKLVFHMLRHDIRMQTERTPEQLQAALRYVEALGDQTENSTFPAKLNKNCIYCDHKEQCEAYANALKGKRDIVCEDLTDPETVAKEREEIAVLAKILADRKRKLESVIKAKLKQTDELELSGMRYRMYNMTKVKHPLAKTIELVSKASALPSDELLSRIAVIDNKALDALLKDLANDIDKPKLTLLKAELEATATKTHSPRFWAKSV